MDEKTISVPHTLTLDNRTKLTLSGVTDVGSFNEESLQVETSLGSAVIAGENLQVTRLSLESGDVTVEGKINAVTYADRTGKSSGFFSKVFG